MIKNKIVVPLSGFTMIELLMVIILVGILGAVSLPQFLDFRQEARVAAAERFVQSIITGIQLQHKQAILKCGMNPQAHIPLSSIELNDVTAGAGAVCTTAQIPNEADRKFFDAPVGSFPVNPVTGLRTIGVAFALGSGESYAENGTCSASSEGTTYGWCYDPNSGTFFAASDSTARGLASEMSGGSESSGESSNSESSSSSSCVGGTCYGDSSYAQNCEASYGTWDYSGNFCQCQEGFSWDASNIGCANTGCYNSGGGWGQAQDLSWNCACPNGTTWNGASCSTAGGGGGPLTFSCIFTPNSPGSHEGTFYIGGSCVNAGGDIQSSGGGPGWVWTCENGSFGFESHPGSRYDLGTTITVTQGSDSVPATCME